jgi:hypothetical protein
LIDFRTYNTNKVVASFRHVSEDGFRDIHINSANTNLFAAALNDQCVVPVCKRIYIIYEKIDFYYLALGYSTY